MSSDNGGLSKLGTALTILFVLSLAALFAELFYLLWRRRRRQPAADQISQYSSSSTSDSTFSSSPKELLYFFCITTRPNNNNSQIQNSVTANNESGNMEEEEVIDIDLMKIGGMFGPPRFLFTIKEEERELEEDDVELDEGKKVINNKKKKKEEFGIRRTSLVDCFMEVEKEESVYTTPLEIDDTTPFSTPCASPLYFTPSVSPAHEVAMEEGRVFSEA